MILDTCAMSGMELEEHNREGGQSPSRQDPCFCGQTKVLFIEFEYQIVQLLSLCAKLLKKRSRLLWRISNENWAIEDHICSRGFSRTDIGAFDIP